MRNPIFILAVTIVFFHSFDCCFAQDNDGIAQVVYLIGNTATSEINDAQLATLQKQLLTENNQYTVLHLGDIIKPGEPENKASELDLLFSLLEGSENGQLIFTPGDKDWNNAERDGLRMVRQLEEQVESRVDASNIFLPSDGCPGPEVLDLSPQLRLIVINTHWWLHPFDIPEAPDADCNNLTKEEFIESLEETIEESVGRNILIVGHHPLTSSGVYGGAHDT